VLGFPMENGNTVTWNRDLIATQFKAIGDEFFATSHNVINGVVFVTLDPVPEGLWID